jgi:hypothetical protein
MTITPEIALEMLEQNTHNRPMIMSKVENFAKLMERGEWILTHQGIAFDTNGILLDGQKRLRAIADIGISLNIQVTTGLPPESFTAMDSGDKRTGGHVLAMEGVKDPNVVSGILRVVLSYREARRGDGQFGAILARTSRSNADILNAYRAYPGVPAMTLAARRISVGCVLPSPAAVGGALYQMTTADPALAHSFVEGILNGEGLHHGDPRLTLRNRRQATIITRRAGASAQIHTFTVLLGAWRAFVNHKPYTKVTASTVLPVVGTID